VKTADVHFPRPFTIIIIIIRTTTKRKINTESGSGNACRRFGRWAIDLFAASGQKCGEKIDGKSV